MRPQSHISTLVLLAAFAAICPNPIGYAAARAVPATQTVTPYHPSLRGTHFTNVELLATLAAHADPQPDPAPLRDPRVLWSEAVTAAPALPAGEAPAASVDVIPAGGIATAGIGSRTARALQQMKPDCAPKQLGCLLQVQAAKTVTQAPAPAPGPKPSPQAKPDPNLAVQSGGKIGGAIPTGGKAPGLIQEDLNPAKG